MVEKDQVIVEHVFSMIENSGKDIKNAPFLERMLQDRRFNKRVIK